MLTLIAAPEPVVSLRDAKAHLRVDGDDEDAAISAYIDAATVWIDGADGWLGRALGRQQWDFVPDGRHLGRSAYSVRLSYGLPLPPLISIDRVTYKDGAGTVQTISSSTYEAVGVGASRGGALRCFSPWPLDGADGLTIRFTAGYRDGVPEPIRQAILLGVQILHERQGDLHSNPTISALLAPYRVFA